MKAEPVFPGLCWRSFWNSSKGMEVFAPVGIIKVCVTDGIATVNHHVFADIDAAVRDARNASHRSLEKHDVAGLCFVVRNFPAQVE